MANRTISIPPEMELKMRDLKHINWSDVCREAITRVLKNAEKAGYLQPEEVRTDGE